MMNSFPSRRASTCNFIFGLCFLTLLLLLGGCANRHAKDDKSGLSEEGVDLQVKMSSNAFIAPVTAPVNQEKRQIYILGTNTSSAINANQHLYPLLVKELQRRGYVPVSDPNQAHYMLLYNVLYVGKEVSDLSTLTTVASGVAGAAVAATVGRDNEVVQNAGLGALVGTVAGAVTGHYFETNTYELVVDIQIRERQPPAPPPITPTDAHKREIELAIRQVNASLGHVMVNQEVPAPEVRTASPNDSWQQYNNQVVGYASALRLQFNEATPALYRTIAREISGIFWDISDQPATSKAS